MMPIANRLLLPLSLSFALACNGTGATSADATTSDNDAQPDVADSGPSADVQSADVKTADVDVVDVAVTPPDCASPTEVNQYCAAVESIPGCELPIGVDFPGHAWCKANIDCCCSTYGAFIGYPGGTPSCPNLFYKWQQCLIDNKKDAVCAGMTAAAPACDALDSALGTCAQCSSMSGHTLAIDGGKNGVWTWSAAGTYGCSWRKITCDATTCTCFDHDAQTASFPIASSAVLMAHQSDIAADYVNCNFPNLDKLDVAVTPPDCTSPTEVNQYCAVVESIPGCEISVASYDFPGHAWCKANIDCCCSTYGAFIGYPGGTPSCPNLFYKWQQCLIDNKKDAVCAGMTAAAPACDALDSALGTCAQCSSMSGHTLAIDGGKNGVWTWSAAGTYGCSWRKITCDATTCTCFDHDAQTASFPIASSAELMAHQSEISVGYATCKFPDLDKL